MVTTVSSASYSNAWTSESGKAEEEMNKHHLVGPQHLEDAKDQDEWRRRTRVADPLLEGFTAWRRETEILKGN